MFGCLDHAAPSYDLHQDREIAQLHVATDTVSKRRHEPRPRCHFSETADLKIETAIVEGQRRTVEADLGAARYLATLIGADNETVLSRRRR
jgi:hypothetical protein